jgi:hypothetical protein
MFIPDFGFYPYRILDAGFRMPDLTTAAKEGNFFCATIFCSHKYQKIVNNFIFKKVKKFFKAKTLSKIVLLTQTFVIKLSSFPLSKSFLSAK